MKNPERISNMTDLLGGLAALQEDTAPIELSIGTIWPTRMVGHHVIVIKDAPATVVNHVVEFVRQRADVNMSAGQGGLIVTFA